MTEVTLPIAILQATGMHIGTSRGVLFPGHFLHDKDSHEERFFPAYRMAEAICVEQDSGLTTILSPYTFKSSAQ